jgi:hypothetical protein
LVLEGNGWRSVRQRGEPLPQFLSLLIVDQLKEVVPLQLALSPVAGSTEQLIDESQPPARGESADSHGHVHHQVVIVAVILSAREPAISWLEQPVSPVPALPSHRIPVAHGSFHPESGLCHRSIKPPHNIIAHSSIIGTLRRSWLSIDYITSRLFVCSIAAGA